MSFIGLAGTHRSGKTTMAKAFAEDYGCDFVTISMTQIMADMGLEPADIQDVKTRLKVQHKAVEACDRVFTGRKTAFISDRTPIDVAAYTLGDAVQGFYGTEHDAEVLKLIDDCIDITNMAFAGVLYVPPSPKIKYVMEAGKPRPDDAYQAHIDVLVAGLMNKPELTVETWFLRKECHEPEKRAKVLEEFYGDLIDDDISVSQVVSLH